MLVYIVVFVSDLAIGDLTWRLQAKDIISTLGQIFVEPVVLFLQVLQLGFIRCFLFIGFSSLESQLVHVQLRFLQLMLQMGNVVFLHVNVFVEFATLTQNLVFKGF